MSTDPVASSAAAVDNMFVHELDSPAVGTTSTNGLSPVPEDTQAPGLVEQASERLLSVYLLQTFSLMSQETQKVRQNTERMLQEMQEE